MENLIEIILPKISSEFPDISELFQVILEQIHNELVIIEVERNYKINEINGQNNSFNPYNDLDANVDIGFTEKSNP